MNNVNLITYQTKSAQERITDNKQTTVEQGQETIDKIKSVLGLLLRLWLRPLRLHLVHNMELRKIPPASRSKYVCLGAFVIHLFSCINFPSGCVRSFPVRASGRL